MANPLLPVLERVHRVPWFVAVPIIAAGAIVLGLATSYFTADLFHETCLNERNPLTGQFEPSNCGEGAKVTRALAVKPSPSPSQSPGSDAPAPPPAAPPASPTSTPPTTGAGGATPPPPGTPAPTPTSPSAAPTPAAPAPEPPAPTPTSAPKSGVLSSGAFQDGEPGHDGAGEVEVQRLPDGSLNLLLKGFTVTNGPDLQVVLSRSADGDYSGDDLVLAKLRANNGTQNYAIPADTDLSLYRSVLIWCRPFDVVFAYATLEVK